MTQFRTAPRSAVALMLCLMAVSSVAQDTKKDQDLRASYRQTIESAREAMNGEMSEDVRRQRMDAYQTACKAFVTRFGKETDIVTGHFDLARAYVESFDPESARPHFEAFLRLAPQHADAPEAQLFLGDVLRATNRFDEAAALYEDFIATRPEHEDLPYARLGLATAQLLSLRFDQAAKTYESIIELHSDHQAAADASLQLMDAYAFAGRYDDARALGDRIAVEVPDAPELEYRRAVLAKLGTPAIELEGVSAWSGVAGTSLDRMRGRVVALCFFMTKSIPCARTLEWLSRLESDMAGQGLTVWGLSKAYKSAKGAKTLDWETKYINRYRENPAAVIREELGLDESEVGDASDQQMWTELGRPIRSTIGLTQGFENHRAYLVRRVPCVVIIDKDGKIRLIIEAGQPEGGFQTRLIENMLRQLANS